MIRLSFPIVGVAIGAVLLAGCATSSTHYAWGSYEELIYASYIHPGAMPIELQVEKLEQDYQRALAAQQPVPPGWHAHLGYLYVQLGKLDQAHQEFMTEKANFPEATVFVDRLLANLNKQ